jgi:hypothetical protein
VKLEIGHLRIFGCPVYIHVPMEKRRSLRGCNKTSKAYRIFIPVHRKTFVSRDVNFEENLASSKY